MEYFNIQKTSIDELKLINHISVCDERGFLKRLFCEEILKDLLGNKQIKQINQTLTKKTGTVRGLHFQFPPYQETKIVSCLKGKVWDVAVDLRKGSPTLFHYCATLLSEDSSTSFLIPPGFAHGFQTLEPNCQMLYLHTEVYNSEHEGAINAIDPIINIKWPEKITQRSERDIKHPMLSNDFKGVEFK
jgi:dTDP-4-dehydrorhamnose 3,5-epimerase